jgi:hypothetical protein
MLSWNTARLILIILGVSIVIVSAIMGLAALKDPLRETNKQERKDARALRKENSMTMRARLAPVQQAWESRKRRFQRIWQPETGRHYRAEGQVMTLALRLAINYPTGTLA